MGGELKTEEFDIQLLSLKFVLNSDELEGELRLLRSLPDFVAEPSNKTIHQWLEKLSTSKNFVNPFKKLEIRKKLRSLMLQERLDAMMLIFVEQELASQINYDDVIDEFKHLHPFD
ncbi:Zinc finger MYM-type protein 1 [Aphis craccivora]|uniref:Zinc finger MYM-type protein 1 n=1 Tax=Aphis craccivora TaxID=307492 RepID=A0A6G0Z8T9_APHCR|nr:Zinc finger MYM-type protein 1 [Aphis craccivora]